MRHQASSLIQHTISSFAANASSPHEQLSRVDFVARLALALSAHSAIRHSDVTVGMSTSPGLGSLRMGLEAVAENCGHPMFAAIAQAGIHMLGTRLSIPESRLASMEGLRNHLFHGSSLPHSVIPAQVAAQISAAIEHAGNKIAALLADAFLEPVPNTGGPSRADLTWHNETYHLSPLFAFSSASGALLAFDRLTSSKLTYKAAVHEAGQRLHRMDDDNFLRRLFRQEQADSFLTDLTDTVLNDLYGFIERGTTVSNLTEDGILNLHWTPAQSGDGDIRRDQLRVGPENAWQWKPEGAVAWCRYSDFLRQLANWPLLKQRLSISFEEQTARARQQEDRLLPLPDGIQRPDNLPCRFQVGSMGNSRLASLTDQEFADRLNLDVEANRGQTYLYFVHAEAGAGKTTALLDMARQRAKDQDLNLPLLLYVSARGNVLESLDQAIDAAVAETRLIYRDSVKALCRSGLLIPIVDGFDELVGSPTYDDALASLRPWLTELGGRGVLLVSARSNYFLSHYKDSLNKQSNSDISVDARLAVLEQWTPALRDEYMRKCGVPSQRLSELPQDEGDLLRIPFFARASIAYLRATSPTGLSSLLAQLIRDYAAREQQKLSLQGTALISTQELEVLFTELAEWMLKNNTREVPLDDLKFVARVVLPGGERPEVQRRLGSLCVVGGKPLDRFGFSHEVFFDFFFGRFVAAHASQPATLKRILTDYKLTPTAARIVSNFAQLDEALLTALVNGLDTPLPDNAGLLWTRRFTTTPRIDNQEVRRVHFGDLDLRDSWIGSATFRDCNFAALTVPLRNPGSLQFVGCKIEHLWIQASCQGLCFESCTIGAVSTGTEYIDDDAPEKIVTLLRQRGARVVPAFSAASPTGSTMPRMAQFFLEHIRDRVATSIVLKEDHLPEEDPSLNWIVRNSDEWVQFFQALMSHQLAYEEPIAAGGSRKSRLRLTVTPDLLLDSRMGGDQVKKFWASLSRGEFG